LAILVTGGAGFIGSHLLDRLAERDDELICIDDFNDFYDSKIKHENIRALIKSKRIKLVVGDVTDEPTLTRLFEKEDIDMVVHLAARAGVRPSIKGPALYVETNAVGTARLLEWSRRNGVRKFVFASSSSVYGDENEVPFTEDANVCRPVSPYAASKVAGEVMCHAFHHLYGLGIVALRFFTVYGPRQRPEMAIHKFARLIDEGAEVPMYGDGTSARDYTYYEDIIDGVVAAIDTPVGFEIVNLGDNKMTELRRLIDLVAEALGKPAKIKQLDMQPGDVVRTCAGVEKAARLLGYKPKWTVDKGIPEFIEWYKSNRG